MRRARRTARKGHNKYWERSVTTVNLIVGQNKKPEMSNYGSVCEHFARAFLGKIFIHE
jgi:hypothetical protein